MTTAYSKPIVATIVGSDKGGVGKSLASSLVIEAYDQARRPLSVIEIDHQGKLSSLMGDRVNLSLAASAELKEISLNKYSAERFYNPVYDKWAEQDSLTDLGANVTTLLFSWMEQCSIAELAKEDGVTFRFVAVTTPDEQALRSAYHAISNAVSALGRDAEYFLLMNETSPGTGFEHYKHQQIYHDLMGLIDRISLKVIFLPYCDSELMEYGRSRSLTPLAVFTHRDRLVDEMELQRVAANTEKRRLLRWITEVQEGLRPLFAAPAVQQPAMPRGDVSRNEAARPAERHEARREDLGYSPPRADARQDLRHDTQVRSPDLRSPDLRPIETRDDLRADSRQEHRPDYREPREASREVRGHEAPDDFQPAVRARTSRDQAFVPPTEFAEPLRALDRDHFVRPDSRPAPRFEGGARVSSMDGGR